MSDAFDARAALSIAVDLRQALNDIETFKERGGDIDELFDRVGASSREAARFIEKATGALKDSGTAARQSGGNAKSAAKEWDALAESMAKANKARLQDVNASSARNWNPARTGGVFDQAHLYDIGKPSRAADTTWARDAKLEEQAAREAARATDDLAEAGRRLAAVQRDRAQSEAREANRQMEIRAAVEQRARAERELGEQLKRQQAMSANASRASAYSQPRLSSYLGQGAESRQKAADTTWVRDYEAQVSKLADSASPRLRYALYDVASTAGVASAALIAAGSAAGVLSAQYEAAFTSVERTLDGVNPAGVTRLREELLQLTRDIPLTFSNISEIATLGNQLGIASGDIAKFTETTAKFSAVTGLTVEASAQAFGSLAQLLRDADGSSLDASQFENLGSSIALVGRRSVATEAEIVSMSTRLAASASNAGFTAQQVIALSGALASLRVAPERAQGVMEIYFKRLNTAISEGGDRLAAFGAYAGVAAGDVEKLVRTDPVEFFNRLATGLGQLDQISQTNALEQLGLQGIRAGEVFGRVSANVEVFNAALADANQGWVEGTELGDQYAKVVDDLASKWQIFLNAVSEAGQAVGNVLAPAIKAVLDWMTQLLQGFAQLAQSPVGQWVIGIAAALGGIVAALGVLATALAVGGAGLLALRIALVETGVVAVGATTGVRGLAAMMTGLGGAVGVSTGAMHAFKVALASTGIGLAVVALGTLAAAFMSTGDAATSAFNTYLGSTAGLADAVAADTAARNQAVLEGNLELAQSYTYITPAIQDNTGAQESNATAIANTAAILGMSRPRYEDASGAIQENTQFLGENTVAWAKNQLMQNAAFQELAKNADFTSYWTTIGADMEEVIRLSANGGESAVFDYFRRLENAAREGGARFQSAFANSQATIADAGWGSGREGSFLAGNGGAFGTVIGRSINSITSTVGGLAGQLQLAGMSGSKAGKQIADGGSDASTAYENLNKTLGGGGGGGGGGTTEKIRTLVDYANDLSSVMKRAFDIRFGGQQALDQITSGWQKIRTAALAAAEAADEHRRKLADMAADKSIKQYWLMVAENYGDELRAAKLRAELADLSADMAKEQKGLSKEQAKANKTLVGNSEAAIENRAEILGLVNNYQSYLQALAASGMSQADLQAKSMQLRAEFVQQATALGYNRGQIELYAKSFNDMATIISKVPRNITVTANVNPALQALAEFEAKAKSLAGKSYSGGTISAPSTNNAAAAKANRLLALQAESAMKNRELAAGRVPLNKYGPWLARIQEISRIIASGSYAEGGYTGAGGKFDPAGIVHRGEFVFSQQATKNMGVNNLAFLHNMAKSGKGMSPVGVGAASGMVELSPYDRMLLQEISDRVGITISERSLQSVTNGGNANAAQRRSA